MSRSHDFSTAFVSITHALYIKYSKEYTIFTNCIYPYPIQTCFSSHASNVWHSSISLVSKQLKKNYKQKKKTLIKAPSQSRRCEHKAGHHLVFLLSFLFFPISVVFTNYSTSHRYEKHLFIYSLIVSSLIVS